MLMHFNNKLKLQCMQLQINMKGTNAHNRTYTKSMRICGRNNDAFGTQKKKKKKRKEIASLLILPTFTEPHCLI